MSSISSSYYPQQRRHLARHCTSPVPAAHLHSANDAAARCAGGDAYLTSRLPEFPEFVRARSAHDAANQRRAKIQKLVLTRENNESGRRGSNPHSQLGRLTGANFAAWHNSHICCSGTVFSDR
jgi:hypothetical protein